ncbi:enoyl-CoA hydratase/isomerase family protein [Pseudoxanthomonas sp.]|uniref:enoyl-CoA hydratase/isomerase family protein n=1 Tax=Pseudoxanthomonas sp. TaxID=1871049 RepID=UPI0026155980|nr:enoyl-CoA hydratase/isomerase family protein [Pseudoxanthomonas sp.]WDS36924.1 MAG: enoyl-CoA hydratase/isomerase family protein [Pseudoxanthomonas sp.]
MSGNLVQIERADGVAHVWLNRPQVHNAFDEHLIAQLHQAFVQLDTDDTVRAVVLGGRGKSFCAGGDLDWMRRMADFSQAENLQDSGRLAAMLGALYRLRKPTIARVHGAALAGGTGLASACDIAVATPAASFGTTEVRIGLLPATIAPYVIRAMGERAARRYFLSGERFDAEQALRVGLVHEVCIADVLDARIRQLLDALLLGAPQALSGCKRLIADVAGHPLDEALMADTSRRIADARASAEAREGIAAFFEKRKPMWGN